MSARFLRAGSGRPRADARAPRLQRATRAAVRRRDAGLPDEPRPAGADRVEFARGARQAASGDVHRQGQAHAGRDGSPVRHAGDLLRGYSRGARRREEGRAAPRNGARPAATSRSSARRPRATFWSRRRIRPRRATTACSTSRPTASRSPAMWWSRRDRTCCAATAWRSTSIPGSRVSNPTRPSASRGCSAHRPQPAAAGRCAAEGCKTGARAAEVRAGAPTRLN